MTNHCRLLSRTIIATALASLATTAVVEAQEPAKNPAPVQLPIQLLPTQDGDTPHAATRTNASLDQQAQLAKLTRMTDQSSTGLTAVKLPDGSTQVRLQGRFMHLAVATPTRDGGHEVSCDAGHAALEKVKHAEQVSAGVLPEPNAAAHAAPQAVTEEK